MHLSSFVAMLQWFAIYDYVKYTCWGSVYLADMHQLESNHPDVHEQIIAGNLEWLFLAVPWGCLRFVIVVFPDHPHLLFLW